MFRTKPASALTRVILLAAALATATLTLSPSVQAADTPAATPAPIAVQAAAAAPALEKIENPYGLEALWKTGDFVSRGTLIILIIMSMGSWYILITKLFEQRKLFRQAKEATDKFWHAGSIKEGVDNLSKDNAFRFIAATALQAANKEHESAMTTRIDHETWVTTQIQRATDNVEDRLKDGLSFLATVGSTAPFVGLFGTVWGIYHALTAIGIAGQASIDKVAGPVGEALIMTAIGLAVAVPAVLGYNWLVRRNQLAMEQIRPFSVDVHSATMSNSGA